MTAIAATAGVRSSGGSERSVALSRPSCTRNGITRCSGTNTSVATEVWLPVPRMPTVAQVSSTVSAETGTSTETGWTTSPSASVSNALRIAQSSCRIPEEYGHRPESRYPPSARTALPIATKTEASLAPGLAPNTSSRATSGKREASRLDPLMLLTTHEVDGQYRARVLVTSLRVRTSVSSPP